MRTYKVRITSQLGTQFIATVKVTEFSTDECQSQDGVLVTVDGLTCDRQISCAVRRPDDEYNFFEGLRGAISRLPVGFDIRKKIFTSVMIELADEWCETPGLVGEKLAEFVQMLGQLNRVLVDGDI